MAFGTLESAAPLAKDSSVLARIQRAGELRVGFNEGIIPFSYRNSAGQLGNFFVYLFVVFALFYHGVVAEPFQLSLLPLISLLSGVGSPTSSVDAVSFLSQWLGLPNQTTSLYVSLMTVTRYGQVIASVAGLLF